jgi:hypothetical protein
MEPLERETERATIDIVSYYDERYCGANNDRSTTP